MNEIPKSPLSRHDLGVIHQQIAHARAQGVEPKEVLLSSRRVPEAEGLRAFGLPVRVNDDLALNEVWLVCEGHRPLKASFEDV